jgi:hypothetical protein
LEGTGRRQWELFQWQEWLRNRLVLRHLREKTDPLAKDRDVVYFLATGDLTKSIDLNPDDPMPYWHRGQVHSVAGDDDLTKTGFAKAPSRGLKFWI